MLQSRLLTKWGPWHIKLFCPQTSLCLDGMRSPVTVPRVLLPGLSSGYWMDSCKYFPTLSPYHPFNHPYLPALNQPKQPHCHQIASYDAIFAVTHYIRIVHWLSDYTKYELSGLGYFELYYYILQVWLRLYLLVVNTYTRNINTALLNYMWHPLRVKLSIKDVTLLNVSKIIT